jgi:L-amino acid N-acyltransferase YncA
MLAKRQRFHVRDGDLIGAEAPNRLDSLGRELITPNCMIPMFDEEVPLRYPKEVVLKEKTEAIIRPLVKEDTEALRRFYSELPERDRWYMRHDVLNPDVVRRMINAIGKGNVFSTVALDENRIVAHASLLMRGFGSTRHVGRLRISVLPNYRHKRLGTWMLLDLIQLAMDKGLDDLRADFVIGIEDAAIEAARKLDFFKVAVIPEYVKSPRGIRYDLQIMVKRLHRSWSDF